MMNTLPRSPSAIFALIATGIIVVLALTVLRVAAMPQASFDVQAIDRSHVVVDKTWLLAVDDPVRFIDLTGKNVLTMPAGALAALSDPVGTPEQNRATAALRARAVQLLDEPGIRLRLPNGVERPAYKVPGSLAQLRAETWLALGIGLVAGLAGCWVLVLRPREWGARLFMASGQGLLLGMITIAISEATSAATPVAIRQWNAGLNFVAAQIFGLGLVGLFARYPQPLVSLRVLAGIAVAMTALCLAPLVDPWRDFTGIQTPTVLADAMGIVVLAVIQGWKSRRDPALRTAFLLIGSALLACMVSFSIITIIPQLLGHAELLSLPVSSSAFLLFYLALAVAVARYRLFDVGGWAVNVAMAAMVLVFVLVVDFVLVLVTGGRWTLSLAFLLVVIAWVPVREVLLRRAERRRNRRDAGLLRGASVIAFALEPERQARLWRELLQAQFSPLSIVAWTCERATILDDGRQLAIPSPLAPSPLRGQSLRIDGAGLLLTHPGQGNRLFTSEDRSVAEELVGLVREMGAARLSYDQGVQSERHRIARDLHDDVGARLMTALHRSDLVTAHADVREAMADMRLIIDGMSGQVRLLSEALADLRHETIGRLALARIALDWPVGVEFDDLHPLPPVHGQVLFSVVRELISNVIRHAGASRVSIACAVEAGEAGDRLAVTVGDDGCGFDPRAAAGGGNGLRNMAKRLEEIGGRIVFRSASAGTNVVVWVPLQDWSRERGMAPCVPDA